MCCLVVFCALKSDCVFVRACTCIGHQVSLTSEDFRDATRALSVRAKEQRYFDLVSVNSDTSSMIMRGKPKPKKQVDPAWLKRRSELAPTREELQQTDRKNVVKGRRV